MLDYNGKEIGKLVQIREWPNDTLPSPCNIFMKKLCGRIGKLHPHFNPMSKNAAVHIDKDLWYFPPEMLISVAGNHNKY